MNPSADEYADLGGGLFRWEAYDPQSKVDLSASAAVTAGGLFFIDPIGLRREALEELLASAGAPPAGVLLTNANHERASERFCKALGVPVLESGAGLEAVGLPGAAPEERAYYRSGDGGAMIVGDAVINLGSHPFSLLPDKYCEDPAELRRSLGRLLEFEFERMLFAHGEPVMSGARGRLAALLGSNRE